MSPRTKIEDNGDEWFEEARTWSRIKFRILEQYFDYYLKKRGGSHPEFCYVDGFAGPGYYTKKGESPEPGSPVLMARFAQRIADEGRSYRLFCINTEIDRDRCERLRAALTEFSSEIVFTLCGAFKDRMDEIIALMEQAPSVCFLDPFGVDGISPAELRPILQRPDTEILINLNTRALHRLAGSASSTAAPARGKVNLLSYVLGDDIRDPLPEWLHERNRRDTHDWERWVVQRYMQHLMDQSRDLRYGLPYPVREKQGGGVKYYLIFASRSKAAFPFMNDFICTEDDDLRLREEVAKRAPGQQSMFEPAHESERRGRFDEIKNEIYEYGMANQGCSRRDIIEDFSLLHLGEFKQKHYRHMIDELVREGRANFDSDMQKTKDLRRIKFS